MSEKNSIKKAQEIVDKYGTFGKYFDTGAETAEIVLKKMIEEFPTQRQMLEIYLSGDDPANQEVIESILRYKNFNPTGNKKGEISRDLYNKLEKLSDIKQKADVAVSGINFGLSFAATNEIERKIEEIKKDESLSDKDKERKLKDLKKQRDDSLVDIGNSYMDMVKTLGSAVPVIGRHIEAIADTGKKILNTAADVIMEHNRKLEEILNEIDGVNSGKITEDDIKRLPKNSDLAIYYNDIKVLEQIGLMDLIKKDPEASKDLKHFEENWAKLDSTISKINKRLVELGDNQLANESVENVYDYTVKDGSKFVRKGKENATQPYDPLLIDLENNGFDTKNLRDGVYFDLDNNTTKEKTSWVDKRDGLLAIDLDNNGTIDNGAELFGDNFLLEDKTFAKSSIQALSTLDSNKDGKIDAKDADFSKILVWQDINQDGHSQMEELKRLSDLNINTIDISNIQPQNINMNDLTLKNIITYIKVENGEEKTGQIGEVLLSKDGIDVKDEDIISKIIPQSEEEKNLINTIKELPNVRSFGNVRTLHNFMYLDKTGIVLKLVQDFIKSESTQEKDETIEKIIIKMTDSEDIKENSKGSYIT